MAKSLVIVESPAKAKTIGKYLGKNYIVKSSVGHIRDLPVNGRNSKADPRARARLAAETKKLPPSEREARRKKRREEQLFVRMGIHPHKNWEAHYEILPGKEKVVRELKKYAVQSDKVFLATDLDREGEAIAWHIRETLGDEENKYHRVIFSEITRKVIQNAFENPDKLNRNRIDSQQARRFLDRVVGYMLSPLLWSKVARGLSAGRVQSVAVRMIVEREREIHKFLPEEYWEVFCLLARKKEEKIRFQVVREEGKPFRPVDKEQTDRATADLKGASFIVVKREDRPTRTNPPPPFITSTLQQAASAWLGFSIKKTMMLAQRLYEAGYITYMRTDSTNLSREALDACRKLIGSRYGKKYLPDQARFYTSKKGAQEAHEAIRPSDASLGEVHLPEWGPDAGRLYDLIWRRFIACQMQPAEYTATTVSVKAGGFELRAKGRIMRFDGYTRVWPPFSKGDEDVLLPEFKENEILELIKIEPSQHFTKPPPRYTEPSLVKEMEKRGIGRPSTYAPIIATIQERGYVTLQSKRFYANKVGDVVIDRLVENFSDLMDYNFTARMEESLDDIANGQRNWKELLNEFYADFKKKLKTAGEKKGGMRPNEPTPTDISCPTCGKPMQVRTASTGVFLSCSGYLLPPKEQCKGTINLIPGDEVAKEGDEDSEARLLKERKRCPRCQTAMDSYLIDTERKLHICGRNPDCSGFIVEQGKFKLKGYDGPVIECDKCGGEMQLKMGRFGKYFSCIRANCKNTRRLLRNGQPAPPKMTPIPMPELKCQKVDDTYVLRDGARGLFLAASQFPKHREIRSVYVDELLPHREELDPKYHYLLDGPALDPKGNRTQIRYAPKSKEQYLITEKDGKVTGWQCFYRNVAWQEENRPSSKKRKARRSLKKSS